MTASTADGLGDGSGEGARESARDGARMALIVTGAGGVCLLVGLMLLGRAAGSYDVDAVLAARAAIRTHPIEAALQGGKDRAI